MKYLLSVKNNTLAHLLKILSGIAAPNPSMETLTFGEKKLQPRYSMLDSLDYIECLVPKIGNYG